MKVTPVALGEVSPVWFLWRNCVDRYRSVGSDSVLPFWWCLRGRLLVVVVVVVVVVLVVIPGFAFVPIPAGFSLWGHLSLSDRLVGHAYGYALHAFICLWIESGD